jgi:hypothetical protein
MIIENMISKSPGEIYHFLHYELPSLKKLVESINTMNSNITMCDDYLAILRQSYVFPKPVPKLAELNAKGLTYKPRPIEGNPDKLFKDYLEEIKPSPQ